jgi:hypothetical protein
MNCQLLDRHFQQSIDILIENIEEISIDEYLQIPNENLLFLFNSSKLSLPDENFLFNLIFQLLQQYFSKNILLQTIYFPLVSSSLLKNFFQDFPIEELDSELFERLKERLFCDVLISDDLPPSTRWKNKPSFISRSEIEEISKMINNHFNKPMTLIESTRTLFDLSHSQEQLISSLQKEN